jgi:NitT/TauT family transport system substrate-binding protein
MPKFITWLLVYVLLLPAQTVRAEDIVVFNYGSGSPPFPWSIAVEKKYFQEEGVDITGIISSEGGGTTVRNMVMAA